MNYKNIDSVINDIMSLNQFKGYVDRADIKYKANRVLSKIIDITRNNVHKIELLDIEDYKITKPSEFQKLIQISYRTGKERVCPKDIKEYIEEKDCEVKVRNVCDKCADVTEDCKCNSQKMIMQVDRLLELSNPQFRYGHMKWFYRYGGLAAGPIQHSGYHDKFELIKCTSDPYFSIDSHIKGCVNLDPYLQKSEVEYRIENEVIRFNKREGQVLLVYLASPTDDKGYLLVPDFASVYDAIRWTVEEEMRYAQWVNGDSSAKEIHLYASGRRAEAMTRARADVRQQSFTELWKDLGKYYGKTLPMTDSRGNSVDYYEQVMNRLRKDF